MKTKPKKEKCFCRLDSKSKCGDCGRRQVVLDWGVVKAFKKLKELDEFAGSKKCDICAVLKFAKRAGVLDE